MNDTAPQAPSRHPAFAIGLALNAGFVLLEAGYGFWADSLALLADAGHNLGDVLGLLLAWGGIYLAGRIPSKRKTYGWRRSTIYAAFFNAVLLLVAVGGIAVEAIRRIRDPVETAEGIVVWVAAAGVVVNAVTALLFTADRRRDLNIRGVFLHMVADAAVSFGVVCAGIGMMYTGWPWLDPAASLLVSAVILAGSWGLMRDSVNLAMDAVPPGIDPAQVRRYLEGLSGVLEVHDLHIWAMSTTETALTAHLVGEGSTDPRDMATEAGKRIEDRFGIGHSTLQWEKPDGKRAEHPRCDRVSRRNGGR